MTEDVLSQGSDRPPRRLGPAGVGLVALALLAAGVYGAVHHDAKPAAEASPTPSPSYSSGWTEYPPAEETPIDTFGDHLRVPVPTRRVTPMLLPGDVPGYLVSLPPNYVAVEAAGGERYAPLLVGLCEPLNRLQDESATYVYSLTGDALGSGPTLAKHSVRQTPGEGGTLDIAYDSFWSPGRDTKRANARCPSPLVYPPLPPTTTDVHTEPLAHRRMTGRYYVSTVDRAFCGTPRATGCPDSGWEEYGFSDETLPLGSLVGAYVYDGEFLVSGDPNTGVLSVIRLPGTRLVRRDGVGTTARAGVVLTTSWRDRVLHLRFNAMEWEGSVDDSPPGPPMAAGEWPGVAHDVRGGLRDYAVRADADVIIERGVTGLGHPKGTPATLRTFLDKNPGVPFWLILDARGRVLRAVALEPVIIADPPLVDPLPPP